MRYIFVGKGTVLSDALKERTEAKLSKLEQFIKEGTEVRVVYKVNKNTKKIEVKLPLNKRTLRAEAVAEDMYDAIDDVYHKLERQVKKYKGRLKRHAHKNSVYREEFELLSQGIEIEETEDKIVKVKKFELKPMTVEEAILEMDLIGHNFFIFKEAESDSIKVIYKRQDDQYSVIEER